MRRKLIVALGIYSILFLCVGLYIVRAIHDSTSRVDRLITLHQVEILREHYLIQTARVKEDLILAGTNYARDFDTVVSHTRKMGGVIDACFGCHHAEPVLGRIRELREQTERYEHAVSRVLTMKAHPSRLASEEAAAFELGDLLTKRINGMIALTNARLQRETSRSLHEIRRTQYVLYVLIAIGPLASAGLGFFFARGLTRPVNTLLRSTRRLQRGDLDHRVRGLQDEFGELADAFNEMAASLKEQMQQMHRAEQMAVVGKLSAGLAHEIKNPLAGIKVAMEILADEGELSEEDRAVVVKVGREVTRLETLMKSFLSFARPTKPQPVGLDVNNLLGTTVAFHGRPKEARPGAAETEIVQELSPLPETMADPMQLQQVFLNLLINAMDAMDAGGTLTVRTTLEEDGSTIRVDFSDTGDGIDPADLDTIFQPFFTTKRGGTGLGLAISRQLIEQHGGTLVAGANPEGGAVFTVRLPVRELEEGGPA